MKKISLFITDIDGVWTDGGMYYDETGNEFKKFNTADSAGVVFLRLLNIPVAIITGETTNMVKRRAEKLRIEYLYQGVTNKLQIARKLCNSMQITLDEVAYIGDDINDIELLKAVGLSAVPANAPDYIKQLAHWVIAVKGGDGAFRAFVEKYLNDANLMDTAIDKFLLHQASLKQ